MVGDEEDDEDDLRSDGEDDEYLDTGERIQDDDVAVAAARGARTSSTTEPFAELGQSASDPRPVQKRKGGRKPIYATLEERKQRNRQAQAAFRERRTGYIKQLEFNIKQNEETIQQLQSSNRAITDECLMLRYRNSVFETVMLAKGIDIEAELGRVAYVSMRRPLSQPQSVQSLSAMQQATSTQQGDQSLLTHMPSKFDVNQDAYSWQVDSVPTMLPSRSQPPSHSALTISPHHPSAILHLDNSNEPTRISSFDPYHSSRPYPYTLENIDGVGSGANPNSYRPRRAEFHQPHSYPDAELSLYQKAGYGH